jgi:hypothetical protein
MFSLLNVPRLQDRRGETRGQVHDKAPSSRASQFLRDVCETLYVLFIVDLQQARWIDRSLHVSDEASRPRFLQRGAACHSYF